MSKRMRKIKKIMKLYNKVQKNKKKFELSKKNPLELFEEFRRKIENGQAL